MELPEINIIVAHDQERGIGKDFGIPWFSKKDLKYFAETTTKVSNPNKKNVVIMGRKTYFSIPEKFRPLRNRYNIVLSRSSEKIKGATVCDSYKQAISMCFLLDNVETIWVIGGGQVYKEALKSPFNINRIYITLMEGTHNCDTFFPEMKGKWKLIRSNSEQELQSDCVIKFKYLVYSHIF